MSQKKKAGTMSLAIQILQVIKAAMPAGAEIVLVPGIETLKVDVSWKLNDEPERPNKMSKTISICVSHEAEQDFASASNANQGAAYNRLFAFLSLKLAQFEPQQNALRHEVPPVEQWVIDSAVVFGF